jgi:DNA (cytosine-5)-methyltransferase 1
MGYQVYAKVLNSRDFGVPQNRERIYIVALRDDIDSEGFSFPEGADSAKRIRDIVEEGPVSPKYYLSETYLETLRRHRARHEALGHGFGFEVRAADDVAGAIVCGGMGRERNLIVDKRQKDLAPVTRIKGKINAEGIRKMTPREWARLQGFPDAFALPVSDARLYRQLGNSVSVPVVEAIAGEIKGVLAPRPVGAPWPASCATCVYTGGWTMCRRWGPWGTPRAAGGLRRARSRATPCKWRFCRWTEVGWAPLAT